MLHGRLDAECQQNALLTEQNETLTRQIVQLKLVLKLERQSKFKCSREEEDDPAPPSSDGSAGAASPQSKKRGAPVGHPGWFRATPTHYDKLVAVGAPTKCPHCGDSVTAFPSHEPNDHFQEDIVEGNYAVVLYRHAVARCGGCRRWVSQPGEGEIFGSHIGPRPLAILRKITFGHRSESGAHRMAKIMTVQETAKRHGRRASDIFYQLYTRPPNRVLRYLYAGR